MSSKIHQLIAEGHLENAVMLFRDRWRLAGNVLRARLKFTEREYSAGRITGEQYRALRENLAKDLLEGLTAREGDTTS